MYRYKLFILIIGRICMEISQDRIEQALEIYRPEAKVLISAQAEYPIINGQFRIPSNFYTTVELEHVTDIEMQLCLNQLTYVGLAELIAQNGIPELRVIDFSKSQKEECLIIDSRKRFRKPIRTNKEITGQLKLKEFRPYHKVILGHVDFDFENKSCIGELELALVR